MRPPDKKAALPHLEWMLVPDSHRVLSRWIQECNYMQGVEGEIDSAHVSWLHAPLAVSDSPFRGRFNDAILTDGALHLSLKETELRVLLRGVPGCGEWRVLLARDALARADLQSNSGQRVSPRWPLLDSD
jgi:hypothetical protein